MKRYPAKATLRCASALVAALSVAACNSTSACLDGVRLAIPKPLTAVYITTHDRPFGEIVAGNNEIIKRHR